MTSRATTARVAAEGDAEDEPSSRAAVESTPDEMVIRIPTMGRLLRSFLPRDTVRHMQNANREQLLAARSLLDAMIRGLDDDKGRADTRRRVEIKLE